MLHCERVVLLRLAHLLLLGNVLLRRTPPYRCRPGRGATNFSGPADVIGTGTNADGPALKIVSSAIAWYPDQREWDRKESRRRAVPVLQRHYCGIQPPDQSIRRAERGPASGSRACVHASCQPAGHAPQSCAMPLACCCLPVQGLGGKSAAHGGPAQLDSEKPPVGDPLSESGRTRYSQRSALGIHMASRGD